MGWTWYHATERTDSGRVSPSREIRKEMRRGLGERSIILDDAFVKGVYYAAVRDNETNEVWALVCKTGTSTKDYFDFGYKDMDEFMGPYEHDCPDCILDLLTPTDHEWANRWRKKCRERNRKEKSPSAFKNLPDGAKATWIAPKWLSGFDEGEKLVLRKGKQNAWKKRSPYVWHIEGTRWCVKPSLVGDTYELIA